MKKSSPAAPSRRIRSATSDPTQDHPTGAAGSEQKPWMRHPGKLRHLDKDTKRINQRIEEAFEQIDEEH